MATNDSPGVGGTGAGGHLPPRRSGSYPCTTAWPQPRSIAPSADATVSSTGPVAVLDPPAVPGPQRSVQDLAERAARIGVFVISEHELLRQGLVDLVTAAPDLLVAGAAATAEEGLPGIAASAPQVVLLDTQLPGCRGIADCRRVSARHPRVGCVLLTAFDDDEALFTAVMAGAAGYLVKQVGGSTFLDGIRAIAAGRQLLDTVVTGRLLDRLRHAALDDYEQQLLELVSQGRTDAQIAEQLGRGEDEVRSDVIALSNKLAEHRRQPEARPSHLGEG